MAEFQVGDTVKVVGDIFHSGKSGTIEKFSADNKFVRILLPQGYYLTRIAVADLRPVAKAQPDAAHVQAADDGRDDSAAGQDTHTAYLEQTNFALAKGNTDMRAELKVLKDENARLQEKVAALAIENRRIWDGFSILSECVGYEPTQRAVYINGTVAGRTLLTNDDGGEYTHLYTLAQELAKKKVENGWV